jgi:hypothetical protein
MAAFTAAQPLDRAPVLPSQPALAASQPEGPAAGAAAAARGGCSQRSQQQEGRHV